MMDLNRIVADSKTGFHDSFERQCKFDFLLSGSNPAPRHLAGRRFVATSSTSEASKGERDFAVSQASLIKTARFRHIN